VVPGNTGPPADVTMGEPYCVVGGSRDASGGPPSIDEIDIPVLWGRIEEADCAFIGGRDGRSRPDGNAEGGPTETGGPRGGGGAP
jgi:hypothetical protein